MHPSLAALDSAGEARLAYAEAASAVSWLHEQVGDADFRRVVQTTGLHRDVMRAIDERLGGEAGSFEGRWKDWLRRQPLEARADVAELHADLTSGAATDGDREARRLDPILAENPRARTLTLVGDLLRGRGHLRSSLLEYEKAARASRFHSPSLAHKRALALLRLDQTEEARHVLQESIARYPEFTPCVSTLASLQAQAGDLAAAERTARRALALNPFDPEPRKILAAAARERGDAATVQRIGRILRVLQDHLGQ
jgi:tetratricopeptide (TPR) repeat protein